MIAVGMFLLFTGYGLGYWGYSMIRGYNLGFKQLFSPTGYYKGAWPPQLAGNTTIIPDGTPASAASADFGTTSGQANQQSGSAGGEGGAPAPPAGVTGQAQIQKAAAMYGWGSGAQWSALLNLIRHESGGNPNAFNPSGAYGIAQALGHGCSSCAGCGHNAYGTDTGYGASGLTPAQAKQANCGNAWYQLIWMMNYIKQRYGSPSAAWAQYCSHPNGCWY